MTLCLRINIFETTQVAEMYRSVFQKGNSRNVK